MSNRIIDRITKAAQIHGLLDETKEADFLREIRAKIVSLEVENKKLLCIIDNGLWPEDLQRDSMKSHIN